MKLSRPNMSDLFRSFLGQGSDSLSPPESEIEVPPTIFPVSEICRAYSPVALTSAGALIESNGTNFVATAAAGAAAAGTIATLAPGLWRITLGFCVTVTGATPATNNLCQFGIARPDGVLVGPLTLLIVVRDMPMMTETTVLIHIPSDGWTVAYALNDPVTALAVNRAAGSVQACRLL